MLKQIRDDEMEFDPKFQWEWPNVTNKGWTLMEKLTNQD